MPRLRPCPRLRRGLVLLLSASAGGSVPLARAANPQPYTVTIAPTGNAALDKALAASSDLESLRKVAPVAPFALISRARSDEGRFATALQSFGYYDGSVTIRIAGHALTDPALPGLLEAVPKGQSVPVQVTPNKGPLFRIGHIDVTGDPSPSVLASLAPLRPGAPAVAADVLAAQVRMQAKARDEGHAFAQVSTPVAVEHQDTHTLDVRYAVKEGPRVALGPVTIQGLHDVNPGIVRDRLQLHQGEIYSPVRIEKAREDLASLGVFSLVSVREPDHPDAEGQVPLTVVVKEAPPYTISFGASYATDLGLQGNISWTDHNVFGNAERLTLSAQNTALLGSSSRSPGYDVAAHFVKPDFLARDQDLTVNLAALQESLLPYDRRAETALVGIARKLSDRIKLNFGIRGETESATQERIKRHYNVIGLPVGLTYDTTDSLLLPTRGVRVALTVTPSYSLSGQSGSHDAGFVLTQVRGSTYINLGAPGRSILALRALVGSAVGANLQDLPPDLRFYAGGSATLRGYAYLSVAPLYPDNKPIGGLSIDAGTVEFRQRIGKNWGAVGFVDAAQVGRSPTPFSGTTRVGVGAGVRYYTSFGPIRADIAVPVNPIRNGDSFELYIGLGEAF